MFLGSWSFRRFNPLVRSSTGNVIEEKKRILVNQVVLHEKEFILKMFSLVKGVEVEERIKYEDAL